VVYESRSEVKISPHDPQFDRDLLGKIIESERVSKISQHIALAITFSRKNAPGLRASIRELSTLTGWSTAAVGEAIAGMAEFYSVHYGGGRSKSVFMVRGRDDVEAAVDLVLDPNAVVVDASKEHLRWATIYAFGHRCSHCDAIGNCDAGPDGRPWCLDRIIPGKVGGEYVADNVTLSCWACNSKRGASPIEQRTFSLSDWRMLRAEWRDAGTSIIEVCNV
jgi:hypothetical protein